MIRMNIRISVPALIIVASTLVSTAAFTIPNLQNYHDRLLPLQSSSQNNAEEDISVIGVVAPLKYVGPYACLQLDFPNLATETQKDVSINFVLDTGANVNTISKKLAKDLDLPVVVRKEDLSILGSAGAGGSFQAGDMVMLGDCELGGMPEGYPKSTFMTNLTAASMDLGIAKKIGGGLLGSMFLRSFPAGVEFDFYGTDGDPPTVIFYYGQSMPEDAKKNAIRVPLEESFWGIPAITVNINGVDLRAMIDTGSPITVLSPTAAEKAGMQKETSEQEEDKSLLKIKGVDNGIVDLSRLSSGASISIGEISLGNLKICVGDLPGLSLASESTSVTGPEVLLGLDALRRTYRMILNLPKNEVWFEKLPETK